MTLAQAVGKRVEQLLKDRNLTQYAFARAAGIPRQTVNIVVKGQHEKVALDTIYQIAETFEMSLEQFFADPIFDEIN